MRGKDRLKPNPKRLDNPSKKTRFKRRVYGCTSRLTRVYAPLEVIEWWEAMTPEQQERLLHLVFSRGRR